MGMGGFVDGIVFHQILQLHNMLSARIPVTDLATAKANMAYDGVFHAAVWLATLAGVLMLFGQGRRGRDVVWSWPGFLGALLLGWGLFNLIEGLVDHYLLGLHHVVEALGLSVWDHLFLAWGAAMLAAGWLLLRAARRGA
jgi:uncharacterized membrane protein